MTKPFWIHSQALHGNCFTMCCRKQKHYTGFKGLYLQLCLSPSFFIHHVCFINSSQFTPFPNRDLCDCPVPSLMLFLLTIQVQEIPPDIQIPHTLNIKHTLKRGETTSYQETNAHEHSRNNVFNWNVQFTSLEGHLSVLLVANLHPRFCLRFFCWTHICNVVVLLSPFIII